MEKNITGARIRDLRMERGLTQTEFADRLGVSPAIISQWENGGRIPRREKLDVIARTFGVDVDYLAGKIASEDELSDLARLERCFPEVLSALGYFSEERFEVVNVPVDEFFSDSDLPPEAVKLLSENRAVIPDERHSMLVWNEVLNRKIGYDSYLDFLERLKDEIKAFIESE